MNADTKKAAGLYFTIATRFVPWLSLVTLGILAWIGTGAIADNDRQDEVQHQQSLDIARIQQEQANAGKLLELHLAPINMALSEMKEDMREIKELAKTK